MNYYKATRPDGTDFRTGTIDYAAAFASGEVIRHPAAKKVQGDASTYLSVSVSASDCIGFSWPCRLFRVEPIGRAGKDPRFPNKRTIRAGRVAEELPAHLAFGPNGEAVVAFLEAVRRLSMSECERLLATRRASIATRNEAWYVADRSAWGARDSAWRGAWAAASYVAGDAAVALLVRDSITPEQYNLLTQPFADAGLGELVGR
jgi:hypothetical protein